MAQVVDGDVLHHCVEIGAAGAWRTVRRGGRIAFAALAFGKAYPGIMHQVTRGLRAGAARHEAYQLVVAVLEGAQQGRRGRGGRRHADRKSTRLNSSHSQISYAVFCLKKKKNTSATS